MVTESRKPHVMCFEVRCDEPLMSSVQDLDARRLKEA